MDFMWTPCTVDRISVLPDKILFKILSCLPTKDAVATSVLTKRWTHLSSLLTTLEFDDSPISHCLRNPNQFNRFSTFKKFVCDVLRSCHSSVSLTRFTLRFGRRIDMFNAPHEQCCSFENNCYPDVDYPLLNSWLCFPLSRGVRELDLDFNVREPGKLPWEIFTSETLEVLRINVNLSFDPPKLLPMSSFHLPKLKKLHFLSLDYPVSAFLTLVLSSCPLLEDLSIFYTRREYPDRINISSPSLRRLLLAYHCDMDSSDIPSEEVVLDTPNLLYFTYHDTILADRYCVRNMNALVEFCLSIDPLDGVEDFRKMLSLLKLFTSVQHLSLLDECNEILHEGLPKDKLPVFYNLSSLHLGIGLYAKWDIVLLEMLKCSPFLETLSFPQGLTRYSRHGPEDQDILDSAERESQCWSTTQDIPSCFESHLKRIIIKRYYGTERELNLIKFLLRNASVLEEMYIYGVPISEDQASVENRLMQLPRASNKCSIKVCFAEEDVQSFMWPPQAAEALCSAHWRGSY